MLPAMPLITDFGTKRRPIGLGSSACNSRRYSMRVFSPSSKKRDSLEKRPDAVAERKVAFAFTGVTPLNGKTRKARSSASISARKSQKILIL
ncbi:MAG: hypothetical protein B6243_02690 [Anaerolineaceae bacterium 4572_5.2]|nr:MAG: hypothetical protein B6243_02690 [Anaerolineaceae bacterium 4572_5.2]